MERVTIRAAAVDDGPGILQVAKRGWNATYRELLSQETSIRRSRSGTIWIRCGR
jgi:hypothetical protein